MDKVRIEQVCPGMVLGKHIYRPSGAILLGAGTVLGKEYIDRLKYLGVPSIYIKDRYTDQIDVPQIVAEATRLKTKNAMREVFRNVESNCMINLGTTRLLVGTIINEITNHDQVMVQLNDIRSYDDEVFGHSVSVGIMSIMMGVIMGYSEPDLLNLGMGSILHDIGKVTIAPTILNKPGKLTDKEFEVIKGHSVSGFKILRDIDDSNMFAANIALQHHERFDGSGYPKGLKDQLIQQYARITAIADVYDAVTSDRIYRPAFSSLEAIKILTEGAGSLYDPKVLTGFVKHVAVYPVGSIVELNNREVAVVVKTTVSEPERPVVRVVLDKNLQNVNHLVDLQRDNSREIVRILNRQDGTLPSVATVGGRINKEN